MSQAMPVMTSPPRLSSAGGAPAAAESADSGHNFEAALAGQRAAGEAAAGSGPGAGGADAADATAASGSTKPVPGPVAVAAGGKGLPPELPPDPAAVAANLLRPNAVSATASVDNPVAGPVPEDAMPDVTDAVATGLAPSLPVLLPTLAASVAVDAPVLAAMKESAVAAAGAARTAPPPLAASPAGAPVEGESVAVLAAAADAGAAGNEPAANPVSLKAVADAPPAPLDNRAAPTSMAGFNALAGLASSASNAAAPAPASAHTINVPLNHPGWGQAFGNQVVWTVNQALPAASLHLSPPELGPLNVQIRLDQDQASIQFVSAHAAVRDAIEAALPRLREMLGGQGIVLADVNVSQHGQSGHAQRDSSPAAGSGGRHAGSEAPAEIAAPVPGGRLGMLDVYV